MNDIVITGSQFEQVMGYLNEQPHKFAAPLIQFLGQLYNTQHPAAQPAAETEEPSAERE